MSGENQDFFQLLSRLNEEKDLGFFCKDDLDTEVSQEQSHYSQVKRFLQTAKEDGGSILPEDSEYLLIALIGKDMLAGSNKRHWATMITGIALAFRTLTPIEIEEVGVWKYRAQLNRSIYNMRNKLLENWYNETGIWSLVSNKQSVNQQFDKIQPIKRAIQFETDESSTQDIYLLKTKNFVKFAPSHYIILVNKYCLHLTNVGIFSGEYRRMKAQIFNSVVSIERAGATTLDMVEIDHMCQILASQSHSLLFNNCQNYAKNVYDCICQDKGVQVEMSSFSGASAIFKWMIAFIALLIAILVFVLLR